MKVNKLIKGLTFLLIGITLLANTLEILEWSVWSNILKLWPLLIVSLGLSLIYRGKNLSSIGPLIIFLGIIVGVGASYMGITFEGKMVREVKTLSREIVVEVEKAPEIETPSETEITPETESTQQVEISPEVKEYPKVEKASIELKLDVGKLTLGKSTPLLYECVSQYRYKEFEPFEEYSDAEKEVNILIYHSPAKENFRNPQNKWELKLNNQIIYSLSIKTSAIDADCNLSGFKVEKLYIESGASNINLILPQYNSKIIIDSGVSNIDIAIPKNVGVTVNIDSGIAVKDLDIDDFIKKDGMYISHNYNESEFKTEIEIDCGVSNIDVDYTDIP